MFEISECPFCGSEASLYRTYGKGLWFVRVKCEMCGAQGKTVVNETNEDVDSDKWWATEKCQMAVDAWNRRV